MALRGPFVRGRRAAARPNSYRGKFLGGLFSLTLLVAVFALWLQSEDVKEPPWTESERALILSLSLDRLGPLPTDLGNAVADNPRAAALGHRLFFDSRLSANGTVSCASCHRPDKRFTDGLEKGVALGVSGRNTPSLVAAAYSPWQYWDGRKDSLWAQALSPLETPEEHGFSRDQLVQLFTTDPIYRREYGALFAPLPVEPRTPAMINTIFANIGKAIAAYERLLLPGPSRFDQYAAELSLGNAIEPPAMLTSDELAGLRLFIGPAACTQCHNGPLLTNHEFHNTGVLSYPGELPDRGRLDGLIEVEADPFNCLGAFGHSSPAECEELRFVRRGKELLGAMRTPSLRNLGGTAPYFHKGQAGDLMSVLKHYNEAPAAMIGHNETEPLGLSSDQLDQLKAFLLALEAPPAVDKSLLQPPI